MNRRKFILHTGTAAAGCFAGSTLANFAASGGLVVATPGTGIALLADPADPVAASKPAQWALGELRSALTKRGFDARVITRLDEARPADFCVVAGGGNSALARDAGTNIPDQPEALTLAPGKLGAREVLVAGGHDPRGLVYALTELADAVALGENPAAALHPARAVSETPANRVRSVMRMFVTDVEDKGWYNDRDFWRSYLTLLASQRFNRLNLAFGLGYDAPSGLRDTYLYFAYPFLLNVPGYNVRANPLPDAERDSNFAMLRFISDEAAARGLQFQLGLWTHAYQWTNSPNANYVIEGLTPQTQAPYSRDALAIILKECPNITGVTFRIHGESGVPEGSYDLWKTIFDGCVRSGRPVEIDMHAKGMDQETIEVALGTGLPVTISPKYWAEHLGLPYHQAAIRQAEMPTRARGAGAFAQSSGARSFLRYGYGDLLTDDRKYGIFHRIWPGTQKVLLGGDPAFIAEYSREGGFCGSLGHEIFDPLSFKGRKGSGLPGGRDGYADLSLRAPGGDFEKYRYPLRLWGRLLYNPATDAQVWQRQLQADYGPAAAPAEIALAQASRILPLWMTAHAASASNNNYWPEMYVNMPIASIAPATPYNDTPAPRRFGTVSPLDPQLFSTIDAYADELLKGAVSGKYSPAEVAQWMDTFAQSAADGLAQARTKSADVNASAFRRFAIDVEAQVALGRFFAQKLRAGVLYSLYLNSGDPAALAAAITAYKSAREHWAHLADVTKNVYVADMTYGDGWFQRGNWGDRLPAIDKDIADMEGIAAAPPPANSTPVLATAQIAAVLGRQTRPTPTVAHTPPKTLARGEPLGVALDLNHSLPGPKAVRLYYRHVDQAENWQVQPVGIVSVGGNQLAAVAAIGVIPAEYTASPYALEYYFEVDPADGHTVLYPGLGPQLIQQPYFVVG